MTQDELAALDSAATQKQPMLLECVENGVWQIRLIFGEGEKNCTAMRQWADAYRANQLVLIGPDAVEKVARANASTSTDARMRGNICTSALTQRIGNLRPTQPSPRWG